MERQGPMTPVAREASCPDTGAPTVPKKEAGKYRLIHHLSYPKGMSVNDGIPSDETAVTYISFDKAVDLVRNAGPGALMAKSDIESAFRLLPGHANGQDLLAQIDVSHEWGFTGTAPAGTLGGGGLPTFDLGCPGNLMPLIHSSIAPSTWKAYGKAWEEWCLLADGKPVGSSEDARMQVTMAFLPKMHAMGVSGSVARNRVSALAFHFKLRGWPDSTKHFLVSQLLKGWRRTDKHGDNRRPISFELLVSLVKAAESVCDSKYEAALTSAAFGIAFFGAMRVSEIVPTALNKPGGLRREDILICDDGLRIRICKSKTDQDSRGTWFPIFAINNDSACLSCDQNIYPKEKMEMRLCSVPSLPQRLCSLFASAALLCSALLPFRILWLCSAPVPHPAALLSFRICSSALVQSELVLTVYPTVPASVPVLPKTVPVPPVRIGSYLFPYPTCTCQCSCPTQNSSCPSSRNCFCQSAKLPAMPACLPKCQLCPPVYHPCPPVLASLNFSYPQYSPAPVIVSCPPVGSAATARRCPGVVRGSFQPQKLTSPLDAPQNTKVFLVAFRKVFDVPTSASCAKTSLQISRNGPDRGFSSADVLKLQAIRRQSVIPLQQLQNPVEPSDCPGVNSVVDRLQQIWTHVVDNLTLSQERAQRFANRRQCVGPRLRVGDLVWLSSCHVPMKVSSPKFKPRFIGPHKISEIINPVSFRLALPASFAIHNVFHRSLLRRYVVPVVPSVDPPAPVLVEGELEYEVEKILDSRFSRRRLQYLVKWKGYGQEDNSWVVASDVHATDLVCAFHLARPDRPGGSAYQCELILSCWKLWEADLTSTPLVRSRKDNLHGTFLRDYLETNLPRRTLAGRRRRSVLDKDERLHLEASLVRVE
ncbi:unnamed protein product [Ranitomeya imitator]|uniref:Chromo domain-containing protein n=1 Tax=Ranitomeya imitator TaxID=111125 RepID=A0ABN9M5Y1_9NEOB|nr:unnamed protein product [Ranitomeya imitator]